MNDHKFCFVICANKEKVLEECLWYIGQLLVPEGYEKEILVIRGAVSMTSGYNKAMKQSDAKYKIYLHQDVLIVNQNILSELLEIFRDASIGLVGTIGRKDFMPTAEYTTNWDSGTVEVCNVSDTYCYEWRLKENEKWMDVVAIDGIFMATQYDLVWDEKNFDGWDFYDISQSAVFLREGYRIVVPCVPREELWCFHDAGQSEYYAWDRYRRIFCDMYVSEGYQYQVLKWGRTSEDTLKKRQQVREAFAAGDLEKTNQYLQELGGKNFDTRTAYIMLYMLITLDEWLELGYSAFSGEETFEIFITEYDEVKFLLRRIYFGLSESEAWVNLQEKLEAGRITMRMLYQAVQTCVFDSDGLWDKIYTYFQKMIRTQMMQGEILKTERLLCQLKQKERRKVENLLLKLIEIFRCEVEKEVSLAVFDLSRDVDWLAEHYMYLECELHKLELESPEADVQKFYEYITYNNVSDEMIFNIVKEDIPYQKRLFQNLAAIFAANEGEQSERAEHYSRLAGSEEEHSGTEEWRFNDHKICFVICANDERYLEECLWYIDKLLVPEGYECETVVMRDALSMTNGYNRAMVRSDAKYKVYLHQDVLIVNPNIILDLLDIFKESSVGMVGVIGKKEMLSSGAYTRDWDAGAAVVCNATGCYTFNWSNGEDEGYTEVSAIDGMFMATQYDLPWEEESFDGWDFYDISQSERIRQAGFRIVVPCIGKEGRSWIFHDAGQCEYAEWDKYRNVFCEKYASSGYRYKALDWEYSEEELRAKRQAVLKAFVAGDYEKTTRCLEDLGADHLDNPLAYVVLFLKVRAEELMASGYTNYEDAEKMDAFQHDYDEAKFLLRRIYFGDEDEAWDHLWQGVCAGTYTMKMLWSVSHICVNETSRLWWNVFARYQKAVRSFLLQGDVLAAEHLLTQLDERWRGKEGNMLLILIRVFRREVEKGISPTVFDVAQNPEELTAHFIRLKLYLRRVEFGLPEKYQDEMYDYCKKMGVSDYLILHFLQHNIFYKEEFCRSMSRLFAKKEGVGSMRANLYAQLAQSKR